MRFRILVGAASLLVVAALAAPAATFASTGPGGGPSFGTLSLTIGSTARVRFRLIVDVPVTITCAPPAGALSIDATLDQVQLAEAVGNSVAFGSGATPGMSFACDGQRHTYTAQVGPPNVPFRRGFAVASMFAEVCGTLADSSQGCTGVTTPWVTVKLRS